MSTYRKATDSEKRMCQAILDDEKAGTAAKVAAQILIDDEMPIEDNQTAADLIKMSINDNLSERAEEYAMMTGCSYQEAMEAARTPDFGSHDNWDVPEAINTYESNPTAFDMPAPVTTATGQEPIDKATYDLAKNANIEKFECGEHQISIRKVKMGTECYNQLDDTHYVTDKKRCYVVTGTCGEEWPIDATTVRTKYGVNPYNLRWEDPPTKVTIKGGGNELYAFRADGQHDVQTSWGDTLKTNQGNLDHGKGDMIVSDTPDFSGDVWVINGKLFEGTYAPAGTAAKVAAQRKAESEKRKREAEARRKEEQAEYERRREQERAEAERQAAREKAMLDANPHSEYARPSAIQCGFRADEDVSKRGITDEFKQAAIDKWKDAHDGKEPGHYDSIPFYEPSISFHDDTWIMHDAFNAKDYEWGNSYVDGLSTEPCLDKDEAVDKSFAFITDEKNNEKIRYGAPYETKNGERKRYDRKNHETMIYVGGYTRMRFGKAENVGGYWKSTGRWDG